MSEKFSKVAAVVPVFNPEPGTVALCQALSERFALVVVVDDGSIDHVEDFQRLPSGVTLLHHAVNRGKGRAIKTALAWLRDMHPEIQVAVFADGDGQHRLDDIAAVAERALATGRATLGVRDFSKSGIPFRSRFGNVCTSFLVRTFFRLRIYDTQTGLRAFPASLFGPLIETSGERYEYEMRLFGLLRDLHEPLEQVPIETVYIENNRASHFRPVRDSIKIYRGLFGTAFPRFIFFSLVGFLTDNAVFTLLIFALGETMAERRYEILAALIGARVISATVNYLCNRFFVFNARRPQASFAKYAALVVLIAALSYVGTAGLSAVFDANGVAITVVKVVVETILFLLSYTLQKVWVFKGRTNE